MLLYYSTLKMVDKDTGQNRVDDESLLKFCDLLKTHQLLADSELEKLQSDDLLLPEKLDKLETLLSDHFGHNHQPMDVILHYNSNQLLEEWNNKSPLVQVGKELKKNYTVIGDQPDIVNGWLWGKEVFPLGRMHVERIDSGRQDTHFSVEEVNDLATISKRRILVIGSPGIGKTSFVWKLVKKWAEDEILEYFLAIFYININTKGKLINAMDALLGENKHLQTKIQASHKVLFILDGWNDRYGSHWDLIVSSKFPQASVMITAQTGFLPWLSTAKWDCVYKVKGLLGHYQMSDKLKHYEILTDRELKSLLSHPLVEDITTKFLQNEDSVKTLANLVHEIIRGITERNLCYNKNVNSLNVEFPTCLSNEPFTKLCKMAFHNMPGGCSIRVDAAEKCSVETFGLADSLSTVAGSTLYTFNHKVIQSFLAAIFMTQLSNKALELNFDNHQFQLVWYFYGHLMSSKKEDTLIVHYKNSMPYYLLGAANNPSTDVVLCKEIKFIDENVTPSCLYSIGHMIACSNAKWSLSFLRCDIHPRAVKLLLKTLQAATENVSIAKLIIKDITTPTIDLLELARIQPILEELVIQHERSTPSFISFRRNDILLSIVSQQQENLQILSLVNVSLGLDGAQQIANGLHPATKTCTHALKQITLRRNNLGPSGTEVLANSLHVCKLLTKLCVSYNDIQDAGAYAIAEYLLSNRLLEALGVVDNTLTVKGSRAIAEALKANTNIISVTLHRASVGSLSCKELVESTIHEMRRFCNKTGCKDVQLHYNE